MVEPTSGAAQHFSVREHPRKQLACTSTLCGRTPPARTSNLPRSRQHLGATGDALPAPAKSPMKKPPTGLSGLPRRLVSRDGTPLFAFIRTLRLAVRARVAADQIRGVPFAEIVIHVREMVGRSEDAASHSGPRPSPEFVAISKRAEAWCVEAYRTLPDRGDLSADRFPLQSPT